MKRLAFIVGILALGFAASTPARADYAVIKFDDTGLCRIFWNSSDNPPGAGWSKIAVLLPDWETAWTTLNRAVAAGTCR